MSWSYVERTLLTRFAAVWPTVHVDWGAFNGATFTRPTIDPSDPAASMFARPVIYADGSAEQAFLSPNAPTEWNGLLVVEMYAPAGIGTAQIDTAWQTTAAGLHRYSTAGLRIYDVYPFNTEVEPANGWFRRDLVIPWNARLRIGEAVSEDYQMIRSAMSTGHGLTSGSWVYRTGGTWAKARADSSATLAQGLVVAAGSDWVDVAAPGAGFVSLTHGLGNSGNLYLSQSTAGAATTTAPATGLRQPLGWILNSGILVIAIREATDL